MVLICTATVFRSGAPQIFSEDGGISRTAPELLERGHAFAPTREDRRGGRAQHDRSRGVLS